jgi:hypothetical protein
MVRLYCWEIRVLQGQFGFIKNRSRGWLPLMSEKQEDKGCYWGVVIVVAKLTELL